MGRVNVRYLMRSPFRFYFANFLIPKLLHETRLKWVPERFQEGKTLVIFEVFTRWQALY